MAPKKKKASNEEGFDTPKRERKYQTACMLAVKRPVTKADGSEGDAFEVVNPSCGTVQGAIKEASKLSEKEGETFVVLRVGPYFKVKQVEVVRKGKVELV